MKNLTISKVVLSINVAVLETDRRRKNPLISEMTNLTRFEGSPSVEDCDDGARRNRDVPLFDLSTIASATNNFSFLNKLGQGGFGSVYKVNFHYTKKLLSKIDTDLQIGD